MSWSHSTVLADPDPSELFTFNWALKMDPVLDQNRFYELNVEKVKQTELLAIFFTKKEFFSFN